MRQRALVLKCRWAYACQQQQPRKVTPTFSLVTGLRRAGASRKLAVTTAKSLYFSTTDPADQAEVKRAVEIAERAADSWDLKFTDFHTPPIVADILANAKHLAGMEAVPWGGYPQAERCRVCMGRDELIFAAKNDLPKVGKVAVLAVTGKFAFDAATHRDFLGACLGTGIERSKVGDILVREEEGAHIMVVPELVEHLEATLTQVRSVSVETQRVSLADLSIPEPRVEQIRTVEASMRLDSIASAGFRISRGKMTDLVKSGDVRVNWKPAKASSVLKRGDVVSCSGKGRVEVGDINVTKKGRYAVELVKFL